MILCKKSSQNPHYICEPHLSSLKPFDKKGGHKMKKTLAILLALVIALSFAGCSSAPTNGFYKNESMDYSYASGETAESDSFMDYS